MSRVARVATVGSSGRPRTPWTALPFHAVLIGAYPALYLFAQNADEQLVLDPLWGPLAISVAAAAGALVALALLLRRPVYSGLVVTLGAVLFFSYGYVWPWASEFMPAQGWFIGAWVAVAGIGLGVIWFTRRWSDGISTGLNVLTAVGVLINIGIIGAAQLDTVAVAQAQVPAPSSAIGVPPDDPPDIYYIILDRYAGQGALTQTYGYDNSAFYADLERRDFYVAPAAHANYLKTPLSLVSSLNMTYLDADELAAEQDDGEDRGPIHRRMADHLAVPVLLKGLGYEYVHISSWWQPSQENVDADRVYRYLGESEFSNVYWRTTFARVFEEEVEPLEYYDWRNLRAFTETGLDALEYQVPNLGEPKFVFAHILLPHDPFFFDADGSFMDKAQVNAQGWNQSYVRQLRYTNGRILRIIDTILAASDQPPVILLQADEGPFPERYRTNENYFKWADATDAELEEKFGILSTFHLPGVDPDEAGLYASITPVNSFRIVFNEYFGGDLRLLEDHTYTNTDDQHFFDFFEITDRLTDPDQ